ncbi:hypothetical protein PISMIDRAFT_672686 [Pisolithus microcarpus 441]|uniref:Calcium activated cation channel n=1 Tax=Pisolithus microcarpus 441 TaxID=765257 RepID=A0A0C9ZIY8_9AGAM|nr:hypothetical protein BKA83DRAFT_672686 [Pisolithus microcarpus]KIK29256.1 hypothetical protein PISMIDRAFT_672686 [Pisolithus microcarpus 441]
MDHESSPLLSFHPEKPSPDTLTKLIHRLRTLTLRLLPIEVDVKSLSVPGSRIITPQVISAYVDAAGDFYNELPYCLLIAHAGFIWDANHNPADHGENLGRAVACEVLARRIVHQSSSEKMIPMVTTRYRHRHVDGEISVASSALEIAIDNNCTIFLSSSESQDVVNRLWSGELVQTANEEEEEDIQYVPYHKPCNAGFWAHFDPTRMSVPRYQNILRIVIWFVFLVVYSQAVREPLERLDPNHAYFDAWEYVLYVMALAFCCEDIHRWYQFFRFASYRAFGFWDVVSFFTDALLVAAFSFRIAELSIAGERAGLFRLRSFQILSFVAPFIWMKLVTIFDGYKYMGTMQICVARMLQESGIFFALLTVLGAGFFQGLYALDVADGESENPSVIVNVLVQGLLQAPNYDRFSTSPAGLTLFYLWTLVTVVILLNVLISLFASAYSDVVNDAEAEYMAFFAGKTVAMIRAPDSYVYPAPFNLIEIFLVAPFETIVFVKQDTYAKINRSVMSTIFFIPLCIIALSEAGRMDRSWVTKWLRPEQDEAADDPAARDPAVEGVDAERGLRISKIKFSQLVKRFPNTEQSSEEVILKEIKELQGKLHLLIERLPAPI